MKKPNPETGEPYKRGEVLPTGRIFWSYQSGASATTRDRDGYFYITSVDPDEFEERQLRERNKEGKRDRGKEREKRLSRKFPKRTNPDTGEPFKIGDGPNDEGLYFLSYNIRNQSKIHPDFCHETWTTFEKVNHEKSERARRSNERYRDGRKLVEEGALYLRTDPATGEPFAFGARREGGLVFKNYDYKNSNEAGEIREVWITESAFHTLCITRANTRIKRKCEADGIPYDLDADYLHSIFPKDGKCPVFGSDLLWGNQESDQDVSPSLDRFDPSRGYVRGNVTWISNRANILKRDATVDEIGRLHTWMKLFRA